MIQNEKGSEFMKKNVRVTLMALGISTNVFMGGGGLLLSLTMMCQPIRIH